MKIAVAAETDASEPRVAATPETVKKMIGARRRGRGASRAPASSPAFWTRTTRRPARRSPPTSLNGADVVLKVRRPARPSWPAYKQGRAGHRHHGPLRQRGRAQGDGRCRRHRLRHGIDAAHHPRAVDGRAVEPGQSRRLPRGDRRLGRIRPRLADDDDRGRHRARRATCSSWASASPACRRSPPRAGSAPSSPRPTCARPPRSRSRASAPSSSRSRTRNSRTPRPPAATPRKCRRSTRPSRPRWSPSTSRSRTSSSPRR